MADDVSILNLPAARITDAVPDSTDEWDVEADPTKVISKMEQCEEELRRLQSPAASGLCINDLPVVRYQLRDLLEKIIPALTDRYDTTFLTDYLKVLQKQDAAVVRTVTYNVMSSIEDALRQHMNADDDEECSLGDQRVVLCAFLSAAALAEAPLVRDARPVLRQLLAYTTEEERVLLAGAWWRALPAAALITLSDAVRAPRHAAQHAAPSLAELLLRAALCALPPRAQPQWQLGAPKLDELDGVLAAWERQEHAAPVHDAERVMLLGRVLAVAPAPLRPALLHRLATAKPTPQYRLAAASVDRKVGVCKLQILFGTENKIHTPKSKKKQGTSNSSQQDVSNHSIQDECNEGKRDESKRRKYHEPNKGKEEDLNKGKQDESDKGKKESKNRKQDESDKTKQDELNKPKQFSPIKMSLRQRH